MEHDLAAKRKEALRYVFNEMDATERDLFEEHYFDCSICAGYVQAAIEFKERFVKWKSAFRILDASVRIFSNRGYSSTTLREIAQLAWVTEGSILRRFGSKRDLLAQAARCKVLGAIDPADLDMNVLRRLTDADRAALEKSVGDQIKLMLRLQAERK
jgi:hypothetical protein